MSNDFFNATFDLDKWRSTRNADRLRRLARDNERIADAQEQLVYLKQREIKERREHELCERWEELWAYRNEVARDFGRERLTFSEMCLISEHPTLPKKILPMDERERHNGKVIVECLSCDWPLNIPDNKMGVIDCPECGADFFVDSTIPFSSRKQHRKQEVLEKEASSRRKQGKIFLAIMIPICILCVFTGIWGVFVSILLSLSTAWYVRREFLY